MSRPENTVPLDALVELRLEKVASYKDPELPYVGLEHLAAGRPKLLGTLPSSASVSINGVFAQDDILFGKLRPNLRKSLRAPFPGYCSTDILVLRARDGIRPDFTGHLFQWEPIFASAAASAAGTKMPRTSWGEVKRYPVRQPESEAEQARIAAVLDTADEAIAKTEAVIAKLRQVRTGLIHDLLTCGLDENGHLRDPIAHPEQFKDSPLGSIPFDWDVCQLRDTIERVYDYRGRTPLKIGMDWGGGDIPALSANNVEMGQVNFAKEAHLGSPTLYAKWMTQGDTEEGDVLMTMEAPLGNIAQVPDNKRYILSQRVILLRPKPQRFTKDYLALQMAGPRFQKELVRQSSGSTAVGIQRAKLELIQVAVPRRKEEQERAAQLIHLNDKQIRQHEAELTKLQSIKSGLMDDLLTGRVRVPESTP
jgi:type I restriction enzyme, S subunit